jgi:hypothetical protein
MVEDIFDPKQLERQGDEKNVIGGIAALNHAKPSTQENPEGIYKFPQQRAPVFEQISWKAISFLGGGVAVYVNPLNDFVAPLAVFAARAQNGNFVARGLQ